MLTNKSRILVMLGNILVILVLGHKERVMVSLGSKVGSMVIQGYIRLAVTVIIFDSEFRLLICG